MDNLVFEESINTEIDSSEFISKKWVYVNDTNSQNYTSQVVIDTTPLSNAGGYVNWQEAYIVMPLVLQLSAQDPGDLPDSNGSGLNIPALKNSFIQMINSMNIEFNNQNIVQSVPLTNVFRVFKLHTSYSQNDLVNNGSNYGYYPDDMEWLFEIADSDAGTGLVNNNINTGINRRNEFWNYETASATNTQKLINGIDSCISTYRSSLVEFVAGRRTWNIYAKLRLKDLNEFFEKAPLLKGATIRMYLNTNQSRVDFTIGAANVYDDTSVSISVLGGLTNPIMLRKNNTTTQTNVLPEGNYSISLSIFKNNNTGRGQTDAKSPLNSCRLYAPIYKFNPIAEQRYLSLTPTKKVEYNDITQFQFSGLIAGENFNFLVSNGISNIQSVLVVPFLTAAGNGTPYNTLLSPFTSTPGTPDPITLSNFNILVSGVNLFLNNQLYDFEQYTQQLVQSNQLNGDLTTGLTSGLISENLFERGYRYYYGNCARQLPSENGVSRSIQIIGQNKSLKSINLVVFVEFKRSIVIDILTGARIE